MANASKALVSAREQLAHSQSEFHALSAHNQRLIDRIASMHSEREIDAGLAREIKHKVNELQPLLARAAARGMLVNITTITNHNGELQPIATISKVVKTYEPGAGPPAGQLMGRAHDQQPMRDA